MLKRFYKNLPFLLIILYIITPLNAMLFNYLNFNNFTIWYLPNFIALLIGLYVIITNIKNIKHKEYLIIGLIIIISIISSILAKDKIKSIIGSSDGYDSLMTFIGYLGFVYCGTRVKSRKRLRILSKIFIFVTTIIAVLTLCKFDFIYKMFNISKNSYYFYMGPYTCFNEFGAVLLYTSILNIFIIFKTTSNKKIIYIITNIILVFTLVLNDTLSVLLAYIIILSILLFYYLKIEKRYKYELLIITITFIISCLTASRDGFNIVKRDIDQSISDVKIIDKFINKQPDKEVEIVYNKNNIKNKKAIYSIGTNRGELWIYGIKYIIRKPIFGYGYENIYSEYLKDNIDRTKPHNRILEFAQNIGLVGLLLYIILYYLLFKKNLKRIKTDKIKLISIIFMLSHFIYVFFSFASFSIIAYFYIALGIFIQNYYRGDSYEL